jgi:hypothetical protein
MFKQVLSPDVKRVILVVGLVLTWYIFEALQQSDRSRLFDVLTPKPAGNGGLFFFKAFFRPFSLNY